MADDEDRDTSPERPSSIAAARGTWPPTGVDAREAEFVLAGGVFTTERARDVYFRQLKEARIDGYDDHHRVCNELVRQTKNELLHEMRGQAQAFELRIAALEEHAKGEP